MTTWATWQSSLPGLFAGLLAFPPAAVAFADQPRQLVTGPRMQLTPISAVGIGVEDRVWEVGSPTANQMTEHSIGQRRMALQVEIWNTAQPLGSSARAYLDRLRTRLRLNSVQTALQELGLSYERCEDPVPLDKVEDGRRISTWAMDVHLGYVAHEKDSDAPGTFIESVEIRGESIRKPNGTPVGASLQPDLEVDSVP